MDFDIDPHARGHAQEEASLAIRRIVHDEMDRENKYMDLARGQIEDYRKHLRFLGWVIAGITVVAMFWSYKSLPDMRSEMTEQANRAVEALKEKTRIEVKKRVDDAFDQPRIKEDRRQSCQDPHPRRTAKSDSIRG
jgi:hypothetical protein